MPSVRLNRRRLLEAAGFSVAALVGAPAIAKRSRPGQLGVMSGDVTMDGGIIWSRTDRPARMIVELSKSPKFTNVRRFEATSALDASGFTARTILTKQPSGEPVFYRVRWLDLSDLRTLSQPATGVLRTAPRANKKITIGFSGDTLGQGWGIDPSRGGMRTYAAMAEHQFDLFIHSGDFIYADGPLQTSVTLDDGSKWTNLMTPAKSKVAETLDEFRGNYAYNLLDEHYRAFHSQVATVVQWDDHETRNNWYPTRRLDDDARYTVKSCKLLAQRARKAFLENTPIRIDRKDPERIFRHIPYGPLLDVFMLDARSYRGPNSASKQKKLNAESQMFGSAQRRWLQDKLTTSKATWKLIACDLPIGLIVGDGVEQFEAVAAGDGPPRGRELEIAALLKTLKDRKVKNVVWVTADVHYAAAHHYHPSRARFTDFDPFWEFVAGPLHAGTFGPNSLDDTFGPKEVFLSIPKGMKPNRSPLEPYQFFGKAVLDPKTKQMQVSLHNTTGEVVYRQRLDPA